MREHYRAVLFRKVFEEKKTLAGASASAKSREKRSEEQGAVGWILTRQPPLPGSLPLSTAQPVKNENENVGISTPENLIRWPGAGRDRQNMSAFLIALPRRTASSGVVELRDGLFENSLARVLRMSSKTEN